MNRAAKIALHAGATLAVALLFVKCSPAEPAATLSPAAERGRQVFGDFCAVCHNLHNPFAPGIQGPALARSSLELLEAKVLRGTYPDGYQPKQPPTIPMPLFPHLKDRIGDLVAFLAEVPEPAKR